jgi:hypothetical protein
MEATRETAVQLLDAFGVPRVASMRSIRRRVREVTDLDVTYRQRDGLQHEDTHGLTSGWDNGTAEISYPPAPSGTQVVIINHEHGHLFLFAHERLEEQPLENKRQAFVRSKVDGIMPGSRLFVPGTTVGQEFEPRLVFEYGRSDFTEDEECLAELIGVELSVRVMRHERARGRDVQFGRVFGG